MRPTPAPIAPKPGKGFLCYDPRIWPPAYRPQPDPCRAPAINYNESAEQKARRLARNPLTGGQLNALLDESNSGTFSQARKAAILGRGDEYGTMQAIQALVAASRDGRVDGDFAAGRIAELAAPPVALVEAGDFVGPLSAAELAERKRQELAGATATALDNAQAAKMGEACHCEPREPDAIDPVSGWLIYYVGDGVLLTPTKKCVGHGVLPSWLTRTWRNTVTLLTGPPTQVAPPPPQPVPPAYVVTPGPQPQPNPPQPKKLYLCMDPRVLPMAWRPQPSPCVPPQIPYPG